MSQKFLKERKILITSWSYAEVGGAALNAVELADQLVQFGAQVAFFSYDIDGPLAQYINKKFDTEVITDSVYNLAENESEQELKNTHLDIDDYDYIWVGGNTIPISIIKQVNTAKKLPKFIFIHLSPLVAFPLNAPLLTEFEEKIASRVLSIGERTTTDCIYRILDKSIPLGEWYNPAPREFKFVNKRKGKLKKIAVISSSHPTGEVMGIKNDIEKRGIQVDYIGKFNNNTQTIDASFYNKYDLVIGIGKDAKYSLVSGIPIYVYGRFGGPGYINGKKYNDLNFSGRGFRKKTSKQIVEEIIDGYQDALEFHEKHREKFIREFSLDIVAEKLFKELEKEKPKKVKFSEKYINWMVSMQIILMQRLQMRADARRKGEHIVRLESLLHNRDAKIASFLGLRRSIRLVAGNIKRKIKQSAKDALRRI